MFLGPLIALAIVIVIGVAALFSAHIPWLRVLTGAAPLLPDEAPAKARGGFPVSAYACAVLGAVLGIGGALVAVASRYWPRPRQAATALPIPTAPEADAYLPCHTTDCAHLERPHDRTPAGLTCRACGTVTTPEATDA